jgi:hypothetical protein
LALGGSVFIMGLRAFHCRRSAVPAAQRLVIDLLGGDRWVQPFPRTRKRPVPLARMLFAGSNSVNSSCERARRHCSRADDRNEPRAPASAAVVCPVLELTDSWSSRRLRANLLVPGRGAEGPSRLGFRMPAQREQPQEVRLRRDSRRSPSHRPFSRRPRLCAA